MTGRKERDQNGRDLEHSDKDRQGDRMRSA